MDAITMDQAIGVVDRYAASGRPHQVVTVNPEFVVQARTDPAFRAVLEQADLALADGVGLVIASRLLGRPLPARVTGVELVERMAALAAVRGYRLFLLGAAPGVAEAAARILTARHPKLQVVGAYAGSSRLAGDAEAVRRIKAVRPHILLVAYGAPAQDLWIARNQPVLQIPVAVGVGGTFDYLSGRVPRAPALVRRLGFEWLYRLVREPWRWRRQLRLPVFVLLVVRQRLTGR